MSSNWLYKISGLVATSAADIPNINSEIRFRCGDTVQGVSLANGVLSSGEQARSEVAGDELVFNELASGQISLQAAFSSGRVHLSGDPEPLLRLAMVLSGGAAAMSASSTGGSEAIR
jgi:hypothetical protein